MPSIAASLLAACLLTGQGAALAEPTAAYLDELRAWHRQRVETPTEFATCPLPPRRNRLAIAIEAGEKAFRGKR